MINKKIKLGMVLIVATIILTGTAFAIQGIYNPNNVKTNINSDKEVIAKELTDLNKLNSEKSKNSKNTINTTDTKNYTDSDVKSEQVYKLYYIDVKNINGDNIDSLLIDDNLDYSIFSTNDETSSIAVVHAIDKNGNKQAVSFNINEGKRIQKIYNKFLKDKNLDDVKVIVHPSHDANKLFYITENGEKYIVPSIVDGKESEVGLKSGVKYTEKEILDNIKGFLKNNKGLN